MREKIDTLTQQVKAFQSDPIQPKLEAEIAELTDKNEEQERLLAKITALLNSQGADLIDTLQIFMVEFEESKLTKEEYLSL